MQKNKKRNYKKILITKILSGATRSLFKKRVVNEYSFLNTCNNYLNKPFIIICLSNKQMLKQA